MYVSDFNPIYNIEKNEMVFNNENSIYLRINNDSVFYYDFKKKTINFLDVDNGQIKILSNYGKSNKKVSKTVIKTASSNGIPKSKLIPIAIPRTSARSQAAIAISARKYKM